MALEGGDSDPHLESRRVWEGLLNVWMNDRSSKTKKRWVVFQGNEKTGLFQLKVFKDSKEKVLKVAYTLSKGSFVGLEWGSSVSPTRPGSPGQRPSYLAIVLVTVTLVFHEVDSSDLVDCHAAIKKYFNSFSWEVKPMTGFSLPGARIVLHLTASALSLTTTDPPEHQRQWKIARVAEYGIWGARVYVLFDYERDYLEMRASTTDEAAAIGDALARLLPNTVPRRERKISASRLPPDPEISRSKPTTSSASDRKEGPGISSLEALGEEPPPVSPRPKSTLATDLAPQPAEPTVGPLSPAPLILGHRTPAAGRGAPSSGRLVRMPLVSPKTQGREKPRFIFP